MSVFKVFFHRKAMKNLYKLPKNVLGRMYVLFNDLGTIPVPWKTWDIKGLRGIDDSYRVRIGQYRVIYSVNRETHEIIIQKIATRKKAYTSDD